eukprot:TRINITY_DN8908_c0_g1_i1.p1 TRINITY_DN8908_c0_g1~~TRINITY_DN8908_c0_g1_i1.p1  ORF type:complete len:523 (+),score=62.95 TRINITY_DN8908_c0_g1_i1:71-1639(+)
MATALQRCCRRAPSSVDPLFAQKVEADRRRRARKHVLGASMVAVLFIIYALAFFDPSNPLRIPFRVNNSITLAALLAAYAICALSERCERHQDLFLLLIGVHFVTYNSISLGRLKALTSPMFDHHKHDISDEIADEFDNILISYLAVALGCHLQMLGTKCSFVLCMFAPTIWIVQAMTLGSVLPDITAPGVVYFLMSLVAFLGLKRSHDVLLQSQWEMYRMGNRRQQEAMRGIMDHLCECVLTLDENLQLTNDCPSLRSLLFLPNASLAGFHFSSMLSSETDKEHLESIRSKSQPGMFPIWLKDSMRRVVRAHIYHASYEDEGQRMFMVGIVENQEGQDREQLGTTIPEAEVLGAQQDPEGAVSKSSTQPGETGTLSRKIRCSEEDMYIMLDLGNGTIVQTLETMERFVGIPLQRMPGPLSRHLCTPTKRAIRNKLSALANSMSGRKAYSKFQDLCLQLPHAEDGEKSFRFHASSCNVESVFFFDDAEEEKDSTQIAKLVFSGEKDLLEMPKMFGRMRGVGL